MAKESCGSVERVRQHVRMIMGQLAAKKRAACLETEPPSQTVLGDLTVEVEREENRSTLVSDGERPT